MHWLKKSCKNALADTKYQEEFGHGTAIFNL